MPGKTFDKLYQLHMQEGCNSTHIHIAKANGAKTYWFGGAESLFAKKYDQHITIIPITEKTRAKNLIIE